MTMQRDITRLLDDSGLWVPSRGVKVPNVVNERLDAMTRERTAIVLSSSPTINPTGAVKRLLHVDATESPVKVQDRTVSQVGISFTRDTSDKAFSGVRIWFKGYKGNANPALMAEGTTSPMSFLCESTGEAVTVIAQAVSSSGTVAALDTCPTTVVALDGVTSAPPAPSIAQSLTTVTNGFQFRFNFIPHSVSDAIDGYWVYRNDVDDSSTATHYKYIKHPDADLTGAYTFQDIVGTGIQYRYWVSAVNKSGLESTKTSAQPTGSTPVTSNSGTTVFRRPTTSTGNYTSPTLAYDSDESTGSTRGTISISRTHTWSGFAALPSTPTSLKLKVKSDVDAGGGSGSGTVEYSLDGGGSWTTIYSGSFLGTQPDVVTLLTSQDPTLVQVRATVDNPSADAVVLHTIYEIWLEAVL